MAKSESITALLEQHSDEEVVACVSSITAARPRLRQILLETLHTQADVAPLIADTTDPSSWKSSGRSNGICDTTSPGTSLARAWLKDGHPGGFIQERPATRTIECWSLVVLLLFNAIMLVTVSIAYYLSIGSGRVSQHAFFISNSIDTGYAHRIGALGITVAFVAYLLMMIIRYVAIKALLNGVPEAPAKRVARLSKAALVLEIVACVGAIGVGAFNVGFNYVVHMSFACDTFFCAVISIFMQSLIDETLAKHSRQGSPRVALRWRICRCLQCVLALLGLCGMFGSGSLGYPEYSSLFEVLMAIALFTYYSTWLGSSGTGYIVGFEIFAYNRPLHATTTRLQSF